MKNQEGCVEEAWQQESNTATQKG